MLFSGKENVFMCLVAFQKMFRKIFSGVWWCSWKYHRKHIFYLLLTFSRLPNECKISFIPQYRNTNKTQKKNHQIRSHFLTFSRLPNKYIISFIPQYRNTNKTQKKKIIKSGQIERRRKRERRLGSTKGYDRRGVSRDCDRRDASWDRNRCEGEIAIGMKVRSQSVRRRDRDRRDALRDRDRRFARLQLAWCFARSRSARRWDRDRWCDLSPFARLWVVLSLSLFLPLRVCELFSLRVSVSEVIWR